MMFGLETADLVVLLGKAMEVGPLMSVYFMFDRVDLFLFRANVFPTWTGIRRLTSLHLLRRWSTLPSVGFGFVEFVLVSRVLRSGLVSCLRVNGLEVLVLALFLLAMFVWVRVLAMINLLWPCRCLDGGVFVLVLSFVAIILS